jgi:hypothetical protein
MPEWSDALCTVLNEGGDELARRCRLAPGMQSEEFEEALGALLRWEATKYLNSEFAEMTDQPGAFRDLDAQATHRLGNVR